MNHQKMRVVYQQGNRLLRVKLASFYALGFLRSNVARRLSASEVQLFDGYSLLLDGDEWVLVSTRPIDARLCAYLYACGLTREASWLSGKTSSESFYRLSLAPFGDPAAEQDRHWLGRGMRG